MQRWQYKVVSTDTLIKKPQDHNIAVYKEEVDSRREISKENLEKSLASLGDEGWELSVLLGEFAVFKKEAD